MLAYLLHELCRGKKQPVVMLAREVEPIMKALDCLKRELLDVCFPRPCVEVANRLWQSVSLMDK